MSDQDTSLHELKADFEKFVKERDWVQFHNPKDLAISISVEAAELLETFQWKETNPPEKVKLDEKTMNKIKEELADIIIYCLGMANRLDVDVSSIVKNKIKRNAEKYPVEKAKGSSKKYTEL